MYFHLSGIYFLYIGKSETQLTSTGSLLRFLQGLGLEQAEAGSLDAMAEQDVLGENFATKSLN